MNISEIQVGNKIKFSNDRSWFTVQARNDRFIICNAVHKNNIWHTIIDLDKNIRGDDNMVHCHVGSLETNRNDWSLL